MTAYDTLHDPPAPAVSVTIANVIHTDRRNTTSALLDTGADVTAIPHALVDKLDLSRIGRLRLEDVQSETTMVYTYAVRLNIAGFVIPRLEVILTGLPFAVIGRDVLNQMYLLLNGPEQTFNLATTPIATHP